MMTWMIHIPVNAKAFNIWAASRDLSIKGIYDIDHASHVLLSAVFGKGAVQPFRLYSPNRGDWAIYGNSKFSPTELRKVAEMVAAPQLLAIFDFQSMSSREVPEDFSGLTRVGFEVRLNPTRRRGGDKSRVIDAWISEAEHAFPGQPGALAESGVTREQVYCKWLSERLGDAADLESFRMTQFASRKMVRSGIVTTGPEIVVQGTVLLNDPEKFAKIVHDGIGRAKAYGFGLFMLRPADKAEF